MTCFVQLNVNGSDKSKDIKFAPAVCSGTGRKKSCQVATAPSDLTRKDTCGADLDTSLHQAWQSPGKIS